MHRPLCACADSVAARQAVPPAVRCGAVTHASQSHTTNQNGASSTFEMCFAPSTFGAGGRNQPNHVSNPDSVIKKFEPHLIYDCPFQVPARRWVFRALALQGYLACQFPAPQCAGVPVGLVHRVLYYRSRYFRKWGQKLRFDMCFAPRHRRCACNTCLASMTKKSRISVSAMHVLQHTLRVH